MYSRIANLLSASLLVLPCAGSATAAAGDDGIVRVKSAYPLDQTVVLLKKDIAAKGIRFFQEIDQHKLAAEAGIKTLPSTLLVFGNPPLGTQFLNAKPEAGIDWPVRVLVQQDAKGDVWAIYTDFLWIANRHGITGESRKPFETASGVIASITSSVEAK